MRSLLVPFLLLAAAGCQATAPDCRCVPDDSCWPSDDDWNHLNSTVGGRLVATVPLGSPCMIRIMMLRSVNTFKANGCIRQSRRRGHRLEGRSLSRKALKVGAGVQGFEALAATHAENLVVVTGECPSVGLAGGYTQGGGHSALSTNFGLAADNTLEFEVFTADDELVKASRGENSDLYWALSGGGTGNFGVVTSATVQAHPEPQVSGAKFLATAPDGRPELIYKAIDAFHAALPKIVDSVVMIIYFFSDSFLQIPALTAYDKTEAEVKQILQPLADSLSDLGIKFDPNFTHFPTYYQHYDHYWGPLPAGNIQVGTQLFGVRLLPRNKLKDFSPTAGKLAEMGVIYIGVGLNVSKFGGNNANSVPSQWRNSIVQVSLTLPWDNEAPWDEMLATQKRMTEEIQPVIEAATPGAGAYVNEADFQQKGWQETFYGINYDKLLKIKKKYDPGNFFYATVAVGSEAWSVAYDGRMCRSQS
ncbi:FAD-linked oxidoreductase yvdP [Fusarium mundagurra]|uniref:FAD-linked oxidoreductase yvdP n=1 Tax=Fusarium mundagurra TaxID=1567541 RepID=A0A8H5Z148_9HYPO|nr:FAD-linked oxidoreductase yvdP [Fusarium mundagurra]